MGAVVAGTRVCPICVHVRSFLLPSLSCWSSINRQSCAETKATPKLKIYDRKLSCWYPSASRGFSESCSLEIELCVKTRGT